MTQTPRSPSAAAGLQEADARRKRALNRGVLVAFAAWVAAFLVYAALKSIQPRSSLLEIVLLLWNAVMIAAPLTGYFVYRRMR